MATDLTLMQATIEKMHWSEARQKVLSQNIANADTPGYQPEDINALDFKALLGRSGSSLPLTGSTQLATTNPMHMGLNGTSGSSALPKATKDKSSYETSPSGNSVVLEEQLLKMNQNNTEHHLATTIYQKNIDMLKEAIKSQ